MRILISLMLLVSSVCIANQTARRIDASANNIATTYTAGATYSAPCPRGADSVAIHNITNGTIAWGVGVGGSLPSFDGGYIASQVGQDLTSYVRFTGQPIYIRAVGALIDEGFVHITCGVPK